MDNKILYKTYHLTKENRPYKKAYLNYPPGGDKKLCDCCDEEKQCASITMVWGDVAVICKDCLEGIVKEFGNE